MTETSNRDLCYCMPGADPHPYHGAPRYGIDYGTPELDSVTPVTGVLPPGCDLPGCKHHYAPGRNLAAEGCICPCWFDGGGWHIISVNPECGAHKAGPQPGDEATHCWFPEVHT